jgi:hypothetical protein
MIFGQPPMLIDMENQEEDLQYFRTALYSKCVFHFF